MCINKFRREYPNIHSARYRDVPADSWGINGERIEISAHKFSFPVSSISPGLAARLNEAFRSYEGC